MDARHFALTFCVFVLANIVSEVEGYTCAFYNRHGVEEYLYCGYNDNCCGSRHARYCCTGTGTIAGAVIGSVVFVIIVASIISCCCCACCPGHRYRSGGTIITTGNTPNYQTMPNTTVVQTGPYAGQPAGAYKEPPPSYQV